MKTTIFTGKSSVDLPAVVSKAVLLLCLTGLLGFVAPQARADEQKDPPTRVARISYLDGSVSFQPGGQGEWGSAAKNRPMTIGDKIWVDKDSRAELQAGQASIHLGSMSSMSFLNLDQGITQVRLAEGSINFRVRELREGDLYEVDAPNLAFTVKQAGAFRIDVNENGDSARVTVLRGEGEVTAGGKTYEVHSGERAEFNGTDNIEYNINRAPDPDGLDRWAAERDLKEDKSVSGKYVSRDMPGYSDLDDYGKWQDEPEYGPERLKEPSRENQTTPACQQGYPPDDSKPNSREEGTAPTYPEGTLVKQIRHQQDIKHTLPVEVAYIAEDVVHASISREWSGSPSCLQRKSQSPVFTEPLAAGKSFRCAGDS